MFDWEFFQETKLIEKYENMIIKIKKMKGLFDED